MPLFCEAKCLHSRYLNESHRSQGFLKRDTPFFNARTEILIFTLLIRPNLKYASVRWNPCRAFLIEDIEKVQKRFLRHLYFIKQKRYPHQVRTEQLLTEFTFQRFSVSRSWERIMLLDNLCAGRIDDVTLMCQICLHVSNVHFRQRVEKVAVAKSQNWYNSDPALDIFQMPHESSSLESDISSTIQQHLH